MRAIRFVPVCLCVLFIAKIGFAQNPGGIIKSPVLWYSGGNGVTGSGTVSDWADQSGNSYDASQLVATNQPSITQLNFTDVLSFDGSNDYMPISSLSYTGTGSIDSMVAIVVFRSNYVGGNYNSNWSFLDFDRSDFFDFYLEGDGELGFSYRGGGAHGIILAVPII